MTTQETMKYLIDWELNQEAFRHSIKDMIRKARKNGKVLALPMEITPGMTFINLMILLLAQVKCDDCDAQCCRMNPEGDMTPIVPPEYQRLSEKYGKEHFVEKDGQAFLPMPCPFLKKGPYSQLKELCTIYRDRPLPCVLYPFQPGATDGADNMILALASRCPEGRRITKEVYMMAWRIRQQFDLLGEGNFLRGIL